MLSSKHASVRAFQARSSNKPRVCVRAQSDNHVNPASAAASILLSCVLVASPVQAVGLEASDITEQLLSIKTPEGFKDGANKEAAKLAAVDEAFEKSDTLKRLLEKSAANKDKNAQAIQDKYCYRQAELGIGDCGGLNFIPGLTSSGKQRTPDWLSDLLGVPRAPEPSEDELTLEKLFGGQLPDK